MSTFLEAILGKNTTSRKENEIACKGECATQVQCKNASDIADVDREKIQ